MSNENNNKYDVTDLTSLEKLEPVRVRPGMYIGSTGTKGLHHCIWEILDNAIDEISNGYGDKATIIINKEVKGKKGNINAMIKGTDRKTVSDN